MASFYYYDKDPLGFCFLVKIGLLLSKPHRGYQICMWNDYTNRSDLGKQEKQKFIYLFIVATCPAHGDGDGDDTVKSNFLVMIFYAPFGNTLTALLRQAKIFWPFVETVSIYLVPCWGTRVPRIEMIPKSTPKWYRPRNDPHFSSHRAPNDS